MNNIYFFSHFNNLLKHYTDTHSNINKLISDKITHNDLNETKLKDNEISIINKYKDLRDHSDLLFNGIESVSKEINNYLNDNCIHDWETDYIDLNIEKNERIKYCNICNITG